jgi:hypothetical protein
VSAKLNRPVLLQRSNERQLPADYSGDVLIWDIDKTYLDTRFSTWRGLLAIPFEFAIDKRTIPGAPAVLRALRRGPGEESAIVPLYFVSGSPPQLRPVVERRMGLDGVDFDGITFKDQLGLLLGRRLQELRGQVAYKLTALLAYRLELPQRSRWLCFGDDAEQDASIFVLFGEICAGLRGSSLGARLRQLKVVEWNVRSLVELADSLPAAGGDPVERIFIHLERGHSLDGFVDRRIVPTRSYLQTALVLLQMGRISPAAVSTVARDLRLRGMPEATLEQQAADAQHRLGVGSELLHWAVAAP